MANISKLRAVMVENNLSVESLSCLTNISKDTLYRRLKTGGKNFTVGEVDVISKVLKLSCEQIMTIFFTDYVA